MADNKVILLFGIISVYLFFGIMYVAISNTLVKYGNTDTCNLQGSDYTSTVLGENTNTLLTFIITGVDCAPSWLNWVFYLLTALTITTVVIMLLHG